MPLNSKEVVKLMRAKMEKTLESTKKEFQNLRTGRAAVSLVDGIMVDYYGTMTPMKQMAAISTPDAKTLAITPWDTTGLAEIEKAILKSEIGLTPMNDGKIIRIQVPQLTDERRTDLTKLVKKVAEEGRVAVRASRHEAIEAMKKGEKAKEISEDESRTVQKEIQKVTDELTTKIDESLKHKEAELHEV